MARNRPRSEHASVRHQFRGVVIMLRRSVREPQQLPGAERKGSSSVLESRLAGAQGSHRMGKPTVTPGGESESDRFTTLIRQHYQALYRAAYRLTRSAVDAEDLVQEVCVRACPRIGELEELEQPRGWLMRVLYRLFVDTRRRYERTHVRAFAVDEEFVSHEPGPAEEADRALDRWRIEDAWRYLNAEHRLLLVLHDVEGYTLAEIQSLTGMKEGTIKSRLHRARVRLGRLLQRDGAPAAVAIDGRGS
jgi:RNA polymerase sigma-70 factor, ECF subfamily